MRKIEITYQNGDIETLNVDSRNTYILEYGDLKEKQPSISSVWYSIRSGVRKFKYYEN